MAFLYPSFLLGLAATAIPVILHLVQLRRAKRVEFSNVRFIKASQEITASQKKLKELLILLSRIFFILFLVLAFAQPFLPGTASVASSDKDVSLVFDNSYSMQNQSAEADYSLLTFAADKARSINKLFPVSTVFSVNNNNSISRNRYASFADAVNVINSLDYSSQPLAANKFKGSGHIFFFSDFQKNQFSPSLLREVDKNTQLHILPLQAQSNANVYIDTLYLEDAFIRRGGESTLHVKITNAGGNRVEDLPVKLVINGQQAAALSIDLPPKQVVHSTINFRVGQSASNVGYVTIDDYPVEFDNTYYFVLKPSDEIKIIEVIDGVSLSMESLYRKEPLFNFTKYQAGSINYARVREADVVLLNGIINLDAALATTLFNYLKEGGSVLLAPPAKGEGIGYESFFNSASIAARISGIASGNKSELLPPAADNPFFQGIFSEYDKRIQMPAAVRSLSWTRATDDILKYRGGAPFLSRFDRGKGQVFLLAAPLHEGYNSLVNHALLLPVMYKVATTSYRQEQPLAYTLNNSTIKLSLKQTTAGEGIYKLQKDSLTFIPEQQIRGGSLYLNIPPDLNEAGIYDLALEGKTISSVAFNYDNRESQLEQYTPEELRSMIGTDKANIHVYDYGNAFSVKNEFEKRYFGVKLWKYCLILCLFFLMAEIALIRFL